MGGALACALTGTVLLVGVGKRDSDPQPTTAPVGTPLALGAAFGFAAFVSVSRLLANRYRPLQSIAIAVSIGAMLLVTLFAITTGVTVRYTWAAWALCLYLGLAPTALAYGLFFHGMKDATASAASIARLAEPLTATVLALFLFGERLGPLGVLGAALLIGAIAFLYRSGASQSR